MNAKISNESHEISVRPENSKGAWQLLRLSAIASAVYNAVSCVTGNANFIMIPVVCLILMQFAPGRKMSKRKFKLISGVLIAVGIAMMIIEDRNVAWILVPAAFVVLPALASLVISFVQRGEKTASGPES